jgi:hypothetical protein
MAEQKIELRKIRDFGQNINDSFLFLRQNGKPLLKSFFAICGIFMIGQAIFSGIYQSHSLGIFDQLFNGRANPQYQTRVLGDVFNLEYFLVLIFMMLTFVSMNTVLGAYMKFYLENDGRQAGIEDIWIIFKKYFFKVFFYSIPVVLLIIIGTLCCVLPGIYLGVVLVPFSFIIMIEDTGLNGAFNRCFEIIKDNFWSSFVIYAVAYLIYSISSGIVSAVVSLVFGAAAYLTTKSIGSTVAVATSFFNMFSHVFYIIYFIAAALQYFTLVEQRDGTGILQRIDSIGNDKNNFDNIEEQY